MIYSLLKKKIKFNILFLLFFSKNICDFSFQNIFDDINEKISYLIPSVFTLSIISTYIFKYINLKNKKLKTKLNQENMKKILEKLEKISNINNYNNNENLYNFELSNKNGFNEKNINKENIEDIIDQNLISEGNKIIFPRFLTSLISFKDLIIFPSNTKKFLLESARKVLIDNDLNFPRFWFINGGIQSGKSFLAKAIAGEFNIPIMLVDGFFLKEMNHIPLLLEDFIIKAEDSFPCIIYIKSPEFLGEQFMLTLNTFLKKEYSIKKIIIIFGTSNSTFLLRNKINKNSNCLFLDLESFNRNEKNEIFENIINFYKINFKFDENINFEKIKSLLKNYTFGEIKSLFTKINQLNCIFENRDIITENDIVKMINVISNEESKELIRLGHFADSFYKNPNEHLVEKPNVNMNSVIGNDHVKEIILQLCEYLKNPLLFENNGIRPLRGMLFSGAPGCGKTLMGRAIASSANANFIYVKGSEIINKYVGVGASKIREIFSMAYLNAPCIIFFDEIDVITKKRSTAGAGDRDEQDQTLAQLLVELDGFENKKGVVVIAATNRPDMIDDALLRSGRLDIKISFRLPSISEREEMISFYLKNKKFDPKISIKNWAEKTSNFSGADIEFIINKAAMISLHNNHNQIEEKDFEKAYMDMTSGYLINNIKVSEKSLLETAYHEVGHAICQIMQNHYPYEFDLVTIEPRDRGNGHVTLGYSKSNFKEDLFSLKKEELISLIITLLGGLVAEEIYLKTTSDGVYSDLEKATSIAQSMIAKYGMGDDIIVYKNSKDGDYSLEIKDQAKKILDFCKIECRKILEENKDKFSKLVNELIINKTLSREEVLKIINN